MRLLRVFGTINWGVFSIAAKSTRIKIEFIKHVDQNLCHKIQWGFKTYFRALLSSLWKEKGPIGQGEDRQKVLHPQKREAPHLGQVGTAIQRQEKLRLEC